jgi:hypothetical protein
MRIREAQNIWILRIRIRNTASNTCVVLQDNRLETIPTNLFKLPLLSILDVANNKLQTVPFALWTCTRFDIPACSTVVYIGVNTVPRY